MTPPVVRAARGAIVAFALAAYACRPTPVRHAVTTVQSRPDAQPPPLPPEPPRAPPRGQTLVPAPRFSEAGGHCRVGEHVVVGTSSEELSLYSVVVAANANGALVAWPTGHDEVTARALDAEGRPRGEPHTATLEGPRSLRIAAQPDGTFIVVSTPNCPSGSGVHDECLAARTFGADGIAREPLATANVGPRLPGPPWAVESPLGTVMLFDRMLADRGTPRLVHFEPHAGGASTITTTDIPVTLSPGERSRLGDFTVDADGHALAVIRGEDGDVLFREGAPPRPAVGLPRDNRVVLGVDGAALSVAYLDLAVALRAHVVQLDAPHAHTIIDRRTARLPPAFDEVRAYVDVGMGGCLHVQRSVPVWGHLDDGVTHVWDCHDSDRPPAGRGLAWTGRGYLVAFAGHAEGRWTVRVAPVTCTGADR